MGIEFGTKSLVNMVTIENKSNIEFGMNIYFKANATVVNPYIINVETQKKLTVLTTMNAGDIIHITTHLNNKGITRIRNSVEENINYLLEYGSVFLPINIGINTFRVGSQTGEDNLETTIEYFREYEAI